MDMNIYIYIYIYIYKLTLTYLHIEEPLATVVNIANLVRRKGLTYAQILHINNNVILI